MRLTHVAYWRLQASHFNPRTPVGCDDQFLPLRHAGGISIHAPQWGATTSRYHYRKRTGYFNPRTPVGCDTGLVRVAGGDLISIHAPQWGATITSEMVCWSALFQSTHPSGVRRTPPLNRSHSAIFQSTHPSGVRHTTCPDLAPNGLFQSTHPSGVRRFLAAYYSNQV